LSTLDHNIVHVQFDLSQNTHDLYAPSYANGTSNVTKSPPSKNNLSLYISTRSGFQMYHPIIGFESSGIAITTPVPVLVVHVYNTVAVTLE
jgi:hypothetical protein